MRIKKLVSAFSALAITVTAIAGLAVTASAAEVVATPIGMAYLNGTSYDDAVYTGESLANVTDETTGITLGGLYGMGGGGGSTYFAADGSPANAALGLYQYTVTIPEGMAVQKAELSVNYATNYGNRAGSNFLSALFLYSTDIADYDMSTFTGLGSITVQAGSGSQWRYCGFSKDVNPLGGTDYIGATEAAEQEAYNVNTRYSHTFDVTNYVSNLEGNTFNASFMITGSNRSFLIYGIPTLKITVAENVTYNVTLKTAPYAKLTSGDVTTYSDHQGNATLTALGGTVATYTISKGGYVNGTTGEVTFDSNKDIGKIELKPVTDGVMFFEDYANTGIPNGLYGTQAESGNNNAWSRIQGGGVQFIGGGSGNRTVTPVFEYEPKTSDIYTLTYDLELYNASDKDTNSTTTVKIRDENDAVVSTIAYTNIQVRNIDKIVVNGTEMDSAVVGKVKVEVNTVTGEATTTLNEQSVTIDVTGVGAPKEMEIDLARNHRYLMDNVTVEGSEYIPPEPPVIAADTVEVKGDDGQPVKGVKAFKATGTFSGGEQVTWNISATIDGEPRTGTETFTIPSVESVASLGLIVDNIPDGIDVTATLSY